MISLISQVATHFGSDSFLFESQEAELQCVEAVSNLERRKTMLLYVENEISKLAQAVEVCKCS